MNTLHISTKMFSLILFTSSNHKIFMETENKQLVLRCMLYWVIRKISRSICSGDSSWNFWISSWSTYHTISNTIPGIHGFSATHSDFSFQFSTFAMVLLWKSKYSVISGLLSCYPLVPVIIYASPFSLVLEY